MKSVRSPLTVVMMAAVLTSSVSAVHLQPPGEGCKYFAETGHYVCDEFLEFFEAQGGLEIFGYPLTETFEEPRLGLKVQYFQRVRMEVHPHAPGSYEVLRGPLVDELGYHFPPASPDQIPVFNSDIHHYYPETGHVVSYAFLAYFRNEGGVGTFGYPLSEFIDEDGHIVQYFQWARMEWHPEDPSGPQMRLTNLGEIYLERFGVPGDYDEPRDPPPPIISDRPTMPPEPAVTALHISASVRHIIIGQGDGQTIFIYVTDQWRQPVEGAAVSMVAHYPTSMAHYECAPADERGFTSSRFEILPTPPGRKVVIDVKVTYGDLAGTTQIFFLPWW